MELENKYGINSCGEGGEFESLVLDCDLYKKKIDIVDSEVIVERDTEFDFVGQLLIKEVKLVDK